MNYPTITNERDCLLTVSELAALFKVPEKTVYHWVSRVGIPHVKLGRHLRFIESKVLNFFEESTIENKQSVSCRAVSHPLESTSKFDCSLTTRKGAARSSRKE